MEHTQKLSIFSSLLFKNVLILIEFFSALPGIHSGGLKMLSISFVLYINVPSFLLACGQM